MCAFSYRQQHDGDLDRRTASHDMSTRTKVGSLLSCAGPAFQQALIGSCSQLTHHLRQQVTTALLAELIGSMIFSFIGSASLYVATVALAPPPNVVMAAFANGLTLGIVSAPFNPTPAVSGHTSAC